MPVLTSMSCASAGRHRSGASIASVQLIAFVNIGVPPRECGCVSCSMLRGSRSSRLSNAVTRDDLGPIDEYSRGRADVVTFAVELVQRGDRAAVPGRRLCV